MRARCPGPGFSRSTWGSESQDTSSCRCRPCSRCFASWPVLVQVLAFTYPAPHTRPDGGTRLCKWDRHPPPCALPQELLLYMWVRNCHPCRPPIVGFPGGCWPHDPELAFPGFCETEFLRKCSLVPKASPGSSPAREAGVSLASAVVDLSRCVGEEVGVLCPLLFSPPNLAASSLGRWSTLRLRKTGQCVHPAPPNPISSPDTVPQPGQPGRVPGGLQVGAANREPHTLPGHLATAPRSCVKAGGSESKPGAGPRSFPGAAAMKAFIR